MFKKLANSIWREMFWSSMVKTNWTWSKFCVCVFQFSAGANILRIIEKCKKLLCKFLRQYVNIIFSFQLISYSTINSSINYTCLEFYLVNALTSVWNLMWVNTLAAAELDTIFLFPRHWTLEETFLMGSFTRKNKESIFAFFFESFHSLHHKLLKQSFQVTCIKLLYHSTIQFVYLQNQLICRVFA